MYKPEYMHVLELLFFGDHFAVDVCLHACKYVQRILITPSACRFCGNYYA